MKKNSITLSIDSDLEDIGMIGVSVKALGMHFGMDEGGAGEVELCVVEAVNNAIEHAYLFQPGHTVKVTIQFDGEVLSIYIQDTGNSMEQLQPPNLNFNPADLDNLPEGGMGLFVISSVMDRLSYVSEAGSNTLTMQKRLVS